MNQIQRAKPVTERTIFQRLSAEFSAAFPPEAEAFLMKNGRGCPDRRVFRAKGREYHLSRFLSASAYTAGSSCCRQCPFIFPPDCCLYYRAYADG